jgi:hypothetical protein
MIETAGSVLRHRAAGGVHIQPHRVSGRPEFFERIRSAAEYDGHGHLQRKPLRTAGMLGEYRNARNLSP